MGLLSNLFALLGLASLFSLSISLFAADHPASVVGAEAAIGTLKAGNARFAGSSISTGKPTAAKRAETAQAQHPIAIVIGCADSRATPEIVFDQNIGDLFVIRNAGNLVDDHTLGSIEYAVAHLGVRLIVVMGHERCGAVTAAVAGVTAPGHVQSVIRDILPAVKAVRGKKGNPIDLAVAENARLMSARIRNDANFGELAREVRIVAAVYDLDSGKIEWPEK